jgi:hypothetical protein
MTKHVYSGFAVNYFMREQIHFNIRDGTVSCDYGYKDITKSDLFRAIQENKYGKDVGIGPKDGYPEIEQRTVRRLVKRMKDKEHVLIEFPKDKLSRFRRRDNKKPYKLHPDTLYAYLFVLLKAVIKWYTGRPVSDSEEYRLIPQIV